jgi:hypothetical protein
MARPQSQAPDAGDPRGRFLRAIVMYGLGGRPLGLFK